MSSYNNSRIPFDDQDAIARSRARSLEPLISEAILSQDEIEFLDQSLANDYFTRRRDSSAGPDLDDERRNPIPVGGADSQKFTMTNPDGTYRQYRTGQVVVYDNKTFVASKSTSGCVPTHTHPECRGAWQKIMSDSIGHDRSGF